MDLACYAVVRENDNWTICASGMRLISCRDQGTAVETARRAAELLARSHRGGEPSPDGRAPARRGRPHR